MELATAALGQLLPKLAALIADEYKLQKGVKGQIMFLEAEMERMQAALNKLSKLPPHQIDDLDRAWARDLKELVYDIEDSVDTLKMPACANRPQGSFRKILDRVTGLWKRSKARHHAAVDMEDIKKRIQEVADRRARYESTSFVVQHDTVQVHDPRLASPFEDKANLVGVGGPTEKITNLLTEEGKGQKLFIVSIVGMGGLGKTTIANLVYERLEKEFQCQAFISVSLRPNMKHILSSILRQVSGDSCRNSGEKGEDELIRNIKNFLSDKRYLIVIDDVWKKEDWKIIKCALVENNLGSRVILTTRNVDVAAELSSVDAYTYELDPLSFEDSKRLLSARVFGEDEGIHPELKEVAEKILKKCGGIPLAITTIASMLAVTPNKTKLEWYNVYKSMGSGLGKDNSLDNMRNILSLSFNDLPYYLKPCLLYLSMFPEDYIIKRGTLIRMWVAEGLIDDKDGGYLYELGDRYFTQLVNRSMIQPVDTDWVGRVTSCRIHDMILDLIITISEQENFVTISGSPQLIPPNCKIRRLSLQGTSRRRIYDYYHDNDDGRHEKVILPSTVMLFHVRSLVIFGDASEWLPPLSRFPALRVLHIDEFPEKNSHLKDLGGLCNLRYLGLKGRSNESVFLEEIGKLQLLQVLDVSALSSTERMQLPASVVMLSQLEHLIINKHVELPYGIGNLMALKQLLNVSLKKSANVLAEQSNLNRLREITIDVSYKDRNKLNVLFRILSNLDNLNTLTFVSNGLRAEHCIADGWRAPAQLQIFDGSDLLISGGLPQCFCFRSELSVLCLRVQMLRQADLQLLGALPLLRFLKLLSAVGTGTPEEQLVIGSDRPFRSLSRFVFEQYRGCCLEFTQGAMPKLQSLELEIMAREREDGKFFVGLENLASLKKISVEVLCWHARIKQVVDAESRIRDAIGIHPNHPALAISRRSEELIYGNRQPGY